MRAQCGTRLAICPSVSCRHDWGCMRTSPDGDKLKVTVAMRAAARPRCDVCGSAGEPLYRGLSDGMFYAAGSWSVSRCCNGNCGLLWLDPMPLAEDLPAAYESYYTHGEPAKTGIYRAGKVLYSLLAGCILWP